MPDAESRVVALLWLVHNDPEEAAHTLPGAARLVVRLAIPSRWPGARVGPSDIERAAIAIARDPGYRYDVARDALRTVERAGVGHRDVLAALDVMEVYDAMNIADRIEEVWVR